MANNVPDFSFKPSLNVAGIASLLSQKGEREERLRLAKQQARQQTFNSLLNAVSIGSNLATQGLARSAVKQQADANANLLAVAQEGQAMVGTPHRPTISETLDSAGNIVRAQKPDFTARSSFIPGGETQSVGVPTPFRDTPEFQNQLLTASIRAKPGVFAESNIKNSFQDPLDRKLKILEMEISKSTIKKNNAQAKSAGEKDTFSKIEGEAFRKFMDDGYSGLNEQQRLVIDNKLSRDPNFNHALKLVMDDFSSFGLTAEQKLKKVLDAKAILDSQTKDRLGGKTDTVPRHVLSNYSKDTVKAIKAMKNSKNKSESRKEILDAFRLKYKEFPELVKRMELTLGE